MKRQVFVWVTFFLFAALYMTIRLQIGRQNSTLHKFIRRYNVWVIERLKKKQRYDKIVKRCRRQAAFTRKKRSKEDLLGVACLYDHDPQNAIEHFNKALIRASKVNIIILKSNLAIAYLQVREYSKALSLLEEAREGGFVPTLTYVLVLMINGHDKEAREYYESHSYQNVDSAELEKLFQFSSSKPETLDLVKESLNVDYLWLYKPLVKDLIDKWEMEVLK